MTKVKRQNSMRFHIVSLPHTQTTTDFEACAYTAKQRKLCTMLKSLGHTVYLYASEDNQAECDELITIVTKKQQRAWFGEYDLKKEFFPITWDPNDIHWQVSNKNAISEIGKRLQKKDFICVVGGICQKQIADAFPATMTVESGIGYQGVFSRFKVFESYAWMHYIYGTQGNDNGNFYDCVIPNYFEPENFTYSKVKDDYFLFLGRFIPRKGIEIAVEVTRRIGGQLVLAGQGVERIEGNTIFGKDFQITGDHLRHIGHVDIHSRRDLLAKAQAVFMPTSYIEPFGGVSVEALLSGTPVISTDFGAFPENIRDGIDGYRFRTVGEAVWAAHNIKTLDTKKIHQHAVANFGVERVKYLYQAYFEQLMTLWDDGFYSDWQRGVSEYQRYRKL